METRQATVYYVNGERQESKDDDLTVRQILEHAGFKPADDFELVRDQPHHVYKDLEEKIEVHQDEQFTAVFRGPAPTS